MNKVPRLEAFAKRDCSWYICEAERGEETKRWHLQGAFVLNTRSRLKTVKNLMGDQTVHLEVMRGSLDSNDKYCSKDMATYFFRHGDKPVSNQGSRTDIKEVLEKYSSYEEVLQDNPEALIRGRNVVRDYFKWKTGRDHSLREPMVYWLYGATGCGKSVCAQQTVVDMLRSRGIDVNDWYPKKGTYKWWDGYTNQRGLIWDEFRYACVAGHGGLMALLNVCDRMPLDVEIKGGIVRLRADCIVITSAYDPVECFRYRNHQGGDDRVDDNISQLIRRLAKIIEIRKIDGKPELFDNTSQFRQSNGLSALYDPSGDREYFERIRSAFSGAPLGNGFVLNGVDDIKFE